jgi:hypothetical protein
MKIVPFCFVFWIGMKCFDYSKRNETKLTTLLWNAKLAQILHAHFFLSKIVREKNPQRSVLLLNESYIYIYLLNPTKWDWWSPPHVAIYSSTLHYLSDSFIHQRWALISLLLINNSIPFFFPRRTIMTSLNWFWSSGINCGTKTRVLLFSFICFSF